MNGVGDMWDGILGLGQEGGWSVVWFCWGMGGLLLYLGEHGFLVYLCVELAYAFVPLFWCHHCSCPVFFMSCVRVCGAQV